jgi:hypothetical protein
MFPRCLWDRFGIDLGKGRFTSGKGGGGGGGGSMNAIKSSLARGAAHERGRGGGGGGGERRSNNLGSSRLMMWKPERSGWLGVHMSLLEARYSVGGRQRSNLPSTTRVTVSVRQRSKICVAVSATVLPLGHQLLTHHNE